MPYLDHAATTPLDERVLEAMLPYLRERFGNASSVHRLGRAARHAVERARERVAELLGAEPSEVVFTSGATEANNLALRGVLAGGGGLVTSAAEHEAVLRPAERLAEEGRAVTLLRPAPDGAVRPAHVAEALDAGTRLVSVMHANNEVGTIADVAGVAAVCRERGVLLHTDAVQTAGLLPWTVDELGADLVSASGHKIYGPKGVGLLWVRGGVELAPLVRGGSQERGRRGGTENVAGIVGFARALELARAEAPARAERLAALRDRLRDRVLDALGDAVIVTTPGANAAPHILNLAFPPVDGRAVDGEMLILGLDLEGVQASSGSACTSGALSPSHVLAAMGLDDATAAAAVRFSMGKDTTEADVDAAAAALERVVARQRLLA